MDAALPLVTHPLPGALEIAEAGMTNKGIEKYASRMCDYRIHAYALWSAAWWCTYVAVYSGR
jgi:hypothetical protein